MDLLTALARHAIGASPDFIPASRFASAGSAMGFDWELSWPDRGAYRAAVGEGWSAIDATRPRGEPDVIPPYDPAEEDIGSRTRSGTVGGAVAAPAVDVEDRADAPAAQALDGPPRLVTVIPTGTPGPTTTESTIEHDGGRNSRPIDPSRAADVGVAHERSGCERLGRSDDHLAVETLPVRVFSRGTPIHHFDADPQRNVVGSQPFADRTCRLPAELTVAPPDLDPARTALPDVATPPLPCLRGDGPDAAVRQVRASDDSVAQAVFGADAPPCHRVGQDEAALPPLAPVGGASMLSASSRSAGSERAFGLHAPADPQARGAVSSSATPSDGRRQRSRRSSITSTEQPDRSPTTDDRAEAADPGRTAPFDRSADARRLSITPSLVDVDAAKQSHRGVGIDILTAGYCAMRPPDMALRSTQPLPPIPFLSSCESAAHVLSDTTPIAFPAQGFAPTDEASAGECEIRTPASGRYNHPNDGCVSVAGTSRRQYMMIGAAFHTWGGHHLCAGPREVGPGAGALGLPHAVAAPSVTRACGWTSGSTSAGVASTSVAIGRAGDDERVADLPVNEGSSAEPVSGASPATHERTRSVIGAIGERRPAEPRNGGARLDQAKTGDHAAEPNGTSGTGSLAAARGSRAGSHAENSVRSTRADPSHDGTAVPGFALPPASEESVAAEQRGVGHRPASPTVATWPDGSRIDHGGARIGGDRPGLCAVPVVGEGPSRYRTTGPDAPAGEAREEQARPAMLSAAISPSVPLGSENARANVQEAMHSLVDEPASGDRSEAVEPEGTGSITSAMNQRKRASAIWRGGTTGDAFAPKAALEATGHSFPQEPRDTRASRTSVPMSPPVALPPHAGPANPSVNASSGSRRRVMRVQTTAAVVLHVGRIRIAPPAIAAGPRIAAAVRAAPTLGLSAYLDRRR